MRDPKLALALAVHNSKGVYGLLVGSGLSRSAGIATGWEITIDLIRKLAHLQQQDPGADPEVWYRTAMGLPPDYSEVLDILTQSSSERMQLLRSYFEPTEKEREHQLKLPTPAHHAIATLVSKGYIRVIVTTNFDRLLEQALISLGIQPTVISTPDAARGAIPLTHSPCTIIKVNGDYLDSRIKNTRSELSVYEDEMNSLLDRVFDEYGLILCGWSAEWDIALRSALERCSTHRFGTYWAVRGQIEGAAQKLAQLRRATPVPVVDADSFFNELVANVAGLEDYADRDDVSPRVAVARVKRYLSSPQHLIQLSDFVGAETERAHKAITSERFSANDIVVDQERTMRRLRAYEVELDSLIPMLGCIGYWGKEEHDQLLLSTIKRIADDYATQDGTLVWLGLRRYPGAILYYAAGLSAMARGNYRFLLRLFRLRVRGDKNRPEKSAIESLSLFNVLTPAFQKLLLTGKQTEFTPLANHLFSLLREPLREYMPSDQTFEDTFDCFEYLAGLVFCLQSATLEQLVEEIRRPTADFVLEAPIGRFVWRRSHPDGPIERRMDVKPGEALPAPVKAALDARFFYLYEGESTEQCYLTVKRGFDNFLPIARRQMGIW